MTCLVCNTPLTGKFQKKFCSKSCSAVYNNKKFPKRKKCKIVKSICLMCNIEFEYYPNSSFGKYCSIKCVHEAERIRNKIRYQNGDIKEVRSLRKYLIDEHQEKCSICFQDNIHNNLPLTLQVDHINGDSDNNLPSNLRLVCPNCHSQLDTTLDRTKKFTKRNIKMHKRSL